MTIKISRKKRKKKAVQKQQHDKKKKHLLMPGAKEVYDESERSDETNAGDGRKV